MVFVPSHCSPIKKSHFLWLDAWWFPAQSWRSTPSPRWAIPGDQEGAHGSRSRKWRNPGYSGGWDGFGVSAELCFLDPGHQAGIHEVEKMTMKQVMVHLGMSEKSQKNPKKTLEKLGVPSTLDSTSFFPVCMVYGQHWTRPDWWHTAAKPRRMSWSVHAMWLATSLRLGSAWREWLCEGCRGKLGVPYICIKDDCTRNQSYR